MDVIYKYPMSLRVAGGIHQFDWPVETKALHVGAQERETVTIWVQTKVEHPNREGPKERRTFRIYGTGFPLDPDDIRSYVGSVQQDGYVWHVYELN